VQLPQNHIYGGRDQVVSPSSRHLSRHRAFRVKPVMIDTIAFPKCIGRRLVNVANGVPKGSDQFSLTLTSLVPRGLRVVLPFQKLTEGMVNA
jgi:hypothetical protein